MNIEMIYPEVGATNVDPQTEILVVFEHKFVKKDDCNIKIDGMWAVRQGQVCAGFRTTRLQEIKGKVKWGLRCPGGLLPRDILVQGWCFHNLSSTEQRFFVRGAITKSTHRVENNWVFTNGGVFSSEGKPFPSGITVSSTGFVRMGDKDWSVPKQAVKGIMDIRVVDGEWVFVSSDKKKHTWVITPTWMKRFNFPSQEVKVTDSWIHAQRSPSQSLHLPIGYVPSFNEDKDDTWFGFTHDGDWSMQFSNDLHIWWNEKEIIAKLDPNALTGVSDDILWTNDDLGIENIDRVDILSTISLLVNSDITIEPHTPAIL